MANALWANVYFKDTYAGRLEEKPGGRCVFTYDQSYLENHQPAIAHTLPLSPEPYISERGLHPFFDNLVAEGWFRNAQARALGVDPNKRFALLLGFGYDLAGAVSIIDPEPSQHHDLDHADEATLAVLRSRASLSGIQRKLLLVKEGEEYRPARANELSTHIAKLQSGNLNELLELEYLTTAAARALLPDDDIVEMQLTTISSIGENALVIPRFDRSMTGKRLHHFEEFNQLTGRFSGDDKYEGGYEEMGQFILKTDNCIPAEAYRLFIRILVCFLLGNTDAHFKNFAMFHKREGLRLTPCYDLVSSSIYPEYQSIALQVCGIRNLQIGKLEPKHLVKMSQGFNISKEMILNIVEMLKKGLPNALATVEKAGFGSNSLKTKLTEKIEKKMEWQFRINWEALVEEAKQRRKELKLTQAKLAELAGVSTPTISRFESGEADIQLSTALTILGMLGLTDKRVLVFPAPEEFLDPSRMVVAFAGKDGDRIIRCAISLEALEDHFDSDFKNPLKSFIAHRERIEHEARRKYLAQTLEADGSVLVKTADIDV